MMKSNQKNNPEPDAKHINLISKGTRIAGDIVSEGDIRIDGYLKGNIKSKGRLVVGESGAIEGEVECVNVEVAGKVKGKISAAELLTMKSTAMVSGEITASKLSVEPGSLFSGTCRMGQVTEKTVTETPKQP
ncbi:MAG: bactofilin family protein [Bacteroidota bacterium]